MPQVVIARSHEPRWPIEHAAMHVTAIAFHDTLVDATDSTDGYVQINARLFNFGGNLPGFETQSVFGQ
jgi:hypothetical protein